MSRTLFSWNAQPEARRGGEIDLHRQVEHGDHVAEQQARAFGGGIAAHALAKPQLANVDVEHILRFGIDRERRGGFGEGRGRADAGERHQRRLAEREALAAHAVACPRTF